MVILYLPLHIHQRERACKVVNLTAKIIKTTNNNNSDDDKT